MNNMQSISPVITACNYLMTEQTSMYLASLSSAVLGECDAPGGNIMKQHTQ